MEKGDVVYMCDVVPNCSIYEVFELTLRTVEDTYAVGVDKKSKQAYMFTPDMIGDYVFNHRIDAVDALKGFKEKYG